MLVLTRKSNQSIMIGDEIEVSVLAIMGEKVRIGIEAPPDVQIRRAEVTPLPHVVRPPRMPKPRPRRDRDENPGEQAFRVRSQPLAARIHARRAPSAGTTTLIY